MKGSKLVAYAIILVWLAGFLVVFSGCSSDGGGKSGEVTIAMCSFREETAAPLITKSDGGFLPSFTNDPTFVAGYIDSGPPDYVMVTLETIYLEGPDESILVWEGEKDIMLDGSDVDLSELNSELGQSPVGTYNRLKLVFNSTARIKGALTGTFDTDPAPGSQAETLTLYTKQDYAYYHDPVPPTGGADDYSVFETAPAEEMDVSIGASGDTVLVQSDYEVEIVEGGNPTITILFDLNRMLRFYNGMNPDLGHGGVNPDDPTDKAYFFAHSVFGDSIGVFIGDAGRIEGYQAIYVNYDGSVGDGTEAGVEAWMTLVFDANDNFLSGHLIGDDDNALTVAKGQIGTYTVDLIDGSVELTYLLNHNLTVYTLYGFERQVDILDRSPTATYDSVNNAGSFEGLGEAEFILRHVQ